MALPTNHPDLHPTNLQPCSCIGYVNGVTLADLKRLLGRPGRGPKVSATWSAEDDRGRVVHVWAYQQDARRCDAWSVDGEKSLIRELFGEHVKFLEPQQPASVVVANRVADRARPVEQTVERVVYGRNGRVRRRFRDPNMGPELWMIREERLQRAHDGWDLDDERDAA